MARQPETRLQQSIQKALRKRWPDLFVVKFWGGPFSPAGIPDLLICFKGWFVAFEVKLPHKRSRTSAIQDETIADLRKAHAIAKVVRSVDEALRLIELIDRLPAFEIDPDTGCWETSRSRQLVMINGNRQPAYRMAYELYNDSIDPDLLVCHACDNPHCINPHHLWQGTNLQNMQDKVAKGRGSKGETHGGSKLKASEVKLIRGLYAEGGISYAELGKQFHVGKAQVARIVRGEHWR